MPPLWPWAAPAKSRLPTGFFVPFVLECPFLDMGGANRLKRSLECPQRREDIRFLPVGRTILG